MGVLSAMMNSMKIYDFEQAFGAKDITSQEMRSAIREWFNLFYGREPDKGEDPCQRIPVAVVDKLTSAVFSEYTATAESGGFAKAVLAGLAEVRNKAMQRAMIGGVAWLKPLLRRDGTVHFSVINRQNAIPLARDEMDRVCSIGTSEHTVWGEVYYTLLERRTVDGRGYLTLENKLYASRVKNALGIETPLNTLEKYAGLAPAYTYRQPVGSLGLIPLRMPLENCVDGSPDAVSVYAPAVGLIHNINRNEAQLNGEFERGESRIIVSADMMTRDKDGKRRFKDHIFTGVDADEEDVGVTIFSPQLREASFLARKAEYLRNVESVMGLQRGLLSNVEAVERTATEVTSSKGGYAITITQLQEVWRDTVLEAVRVCGVLGRLYRVYDGPEIEPEKAVRISFGDGVLFDRDKVNQELLSQVQSGLIMPERYLGWYYDLPCETAEERAKIREAYMPELAALTGGD
ncbi:MAG: phage portal protein [Oscillospiraceae bacterium]|nr:phage portal protein [Oscillospiraceae bacterium]